VLILLVGVGAAWVWQNPGFVRLSLDSLFPGSSRPDPNAIAIKAIEERVARLEQRPAPDLTSLTQRLDALEKRTQQSQAMQPVQPAADLRPIVARLNVLEARANQTPPAAREPGSPSPAPDLQARLDVLEKFVAERSLEAARLDALAAQVEAMATRDPTAALRDELSRLDRQLRDLAANEAKLAEQSERAVRLARWEIALAAGHPLGQIPDNAPPALARFAATAPPTLASLRLSFPAASRTALKASTPDTEGKPFLDRVVARLRDSRLITVREGDHVVIGNQAAATLAQAEALLDAGDLDGAVQVVSSLSGPPAEKMGPWLSDAKSLLAAREALGSLAGPG
jgi:hypothetical protein